MSCTKICSVIGVLCVSSWVRVDLAARIPRQTSAKQQGGAVLFFVAHQGQLRDILFDPIIFNQVLVNQGSAYNNNNGVFTAPVAGIYQFVFAAQLCRGDHSNVWSFMVNGERRMSCHAQLSGGDTNLNTCYFMVELQKDDRVWVKQNVGGCAWASTTSNTITFSGVMLASEGMSTLEGKYGSGSSCPMPTMEKNRTPVSGCAGWSVSLSIWVSLLLRYLITV
ncbi:Complement C1q-like protein 4 C1q and tumor necrosis factor-related protein 11 [Channa argus]|uniref:Complement C1q-like protein 4 C1q and tumor necrosis factor-related protein 11 n=1 Tax=Channa argus TaxID=215402 RepID=A0A6G1QAP5_CHAAH|nr:Complement C1q-like protein 4 C1q and tumor necrosis factor-related protein 11 [Channa argus]